MGDYKLKYTGEEIDELLDTVKYGSGGCEYVTVDNKIFRFDGNIEGKASFEIPMEDQTMTFVHVSDIVPTYEQLVEGGYTINGAGEMRETVEFNGDNTEDLGDLITCGSIIIAKKDNADFMEVITVPKAGIYFTGQVVEGAWYGCTTLVTKSETLSFGKVQYPKNSVVTAHVSIENGSECSIDLLYDEMKTLLSLGNLLVLAATGDEGENINYYNLVASSSRAGLCFSCAHDLNWNISGATTTSEAVFFISISPTNEITYER